MSLQKMYLLEKYLLSYEKFQIYIFCYNGILPKILLHFLFF